MLDVTFLLLLINCPQNPHARIAITEDKDWMSLIVEVNFPPFFPDNFLSFSP